MRSFPALLLTISVSSFVLGCQGGESKALTTGLAWKFFDEGAKLARVEHKKLLIDVYTHWCTWCKKIDREVYVVVKLNAESSKQLMYNGRSFTETQFAHAMGATGYPTTVFLDSDLKPITKIAGFIPGKDFVNIVRFIGEDHYRTTTYQDFLSQQGAPKVQ
jgi:thioredoxin-related protein